ncbi:MULTISPECIES: class I SAM-dependent methyltransferase [unclassified Sphingomonas]|uniref:class I SAM-dependent methyltransferase n=1 Tax=unclassified Sphingomonas TaxID=196159 RepID=UPI0006FCD9A3|nr:MULTISPECIES: class I SAM-dependent methyltransferase [unclassified Sphingomonas]KQX19284.1 hypothetical protein ASD17_12110 [Sphingomonas sp. Root1294]KQY65488.1 hypothetical protein ASD39_15310 [Sphingomonas sp. Root50]KRB95214.1 hypothetical protein ASE22_04750 [Sphingomonas sp. Root720]
MSDWSHGYDVSGLYTYSFFREMAPDWLDLCARVSGNMAPRRGEGGSFRYLELGTGQGAGLCAMAAANPQGEFLGIDFHPGHIAHAQELAAASGLTNIRFIEADFVALAAQWPADFGTFDYIGLHGIYSWVPADVRRTVVECIAHASRPGALVYNSYNTQPGWLTTVPFQHVASRLKLAAGQGSDAALGNAIALFDKLAAADGAIFKAMPPLKMRLDSVRTKDRSYLAQEYLHDNWHPLWHSEVARELAGAKLGYVGSATITEMLLPGVLGREMQDLVEAQPTPSLQQDVQDIVINQTFRRDLFCRGPRPIVGSDRAAIADTMVHLVTVPRSQGPLVVEATFGQLPIDREAVDAVVAALGEGAKPIGELAALPKVREKVGSRGVRTILLMIHNRIAAVGSAEPAAAAVSDRFNAAIARAGSRGQSYRFLAAAQLGSSVTVREIDLMMLDAWLESSRKADAAALAEGAASRLAALGRKIERDGKPLDSAEAGQYLSKLSAAFLDRLIPTWRRLGVLA